MLAFLSPMFNGIRARGVARRSPYSKALAELPPSLYPHWKRTARLEFKGIPQDALFFAQSAEGLMAFFDCVARSGKPCALPSKAADSVWHAWKTMAPADLAAFCTRHFGRTIPHTEAADMKADMAAALATSLVHARRAEGLDPAGLNVPRMFSLDRRLGMPGGYAYRLAGGKMAFSHLDHAGKPVGDLRYPAALAATGLLAAGLVSQQTYQEELRKQQSASAGSSCGSTGSSCGSSACDGAGSSSCDGGSSCGSGCGSGCGGGGS
jgi:hypothetical protein